MEAYVVLLILIVTGSVRPDQLDHSGMHCGQLDYIKETDNRGTRPEEC